MATKIKWHALDDLLDALEKWMLARVRYDRQLRGLCKNPGDVQVNFHDVTDARESIRRLLLEIFA